MSRIDVSELMSDPDFIDKVQLVSRTTQVNSYGENLVGETTVNTVGCVQPASGKTLARLPEALRLTNVSSFWLKAQIIASEPGKYSSILVFKGQRYQVQTVMDWSSWGAGWTEGTCIAEKPAP